MMVLHHWIFPSSVPLSLLQAQSVRVERALLEDELQREKILQKKRAVEQKEQIRRARIMAARKMEQKKMTELMQAHEVSREKIA